MTTVSQYGTHDIQYCCLKYGLELPFPPEYTFKPVNFIILASNNKYILEIIMHTRGCSRECNAKRESCVFKVRSG